MNREIRVLWMKIVAMIVVLGSTTFIAYSDALKGGLVWDANSYLIDNPYITKFNLENIKWMFTTFFLSNWHPLTWLSYALDYWLYEAIWGVALTNIILHGANTILLFFFTLTLINISGQPGTLFKNIKDQDLVAAFFVAILFCIHPQHVESVAWLAERKDVLCLFFVLLTFILYIIYTRIETGFKRAIYYCLALVFFIMALLSKPMAVTVPFLLVLGDFYPLKRMLEENSDTLIVNWHSIRKSIFEKLPFFLGSLAVMVITMSAQTAAINPLDKFGLQLRFLNAVKSYFFYISKMFFPINLLPLYNDFPKEDDLMNFIYVGGFFMVNILFLYLWLKNYKYWLISWLFYVIALAPVIGIVKVGSQSLADRYVYLPTIPFYILIGIGFSILLFKIKHLFLKAVFLFSIIGLCCILLIKTQSQIVVWQNELYLWNYIVKILPNHGPANTGLGNYYFNNGYYEKAIEHYRTASNSGELIAYSIPAWAISYLKLNKLNEALLIYKFILENKTDVGIPMSCIYYNIGLIYARQNLIDYAKQSLLLVLSDSPEEFINAHRLLSKMEYGSSNQLQEKNNMFSAYQYCEKFYNPKA